MATLKELNDKIEEMTDAVETEHAQVNTVVDGLKAEVARLQAIVDSGVVTPADLDASIASINSAITALQVIVPDVE